MTDTSIKRRLMTISIRHGESGMFFATSEDEPTFFLAQRSRKDLLAILPWALENTMRSLYSRDVTALPPEDGAEDEVHICLVNRDQLSELPQACA